LEEGIVGGTLAMTLCGALAASTMQSLARAKRQVPQSSSSSSYVRLADTVLGTGAAKLVFFLTLSASLGVCSTYLVFIGQTLESLSNDASSHNVVRSLLPDVSERTWEAGVAAFLLFPLSLIRDYSIFAFTSALGVIAVVGGIVVTLTYGMWVDPGWREAWQGLESVPLWPESLAIAFGSSFGTIAYLFCINFLTFPIMNSMRELDKYGGAVNFAVAGVWLVNVVFAVLCVAFYGDDTQDLVLANLENGPYLSALKLLLCVDLLFTFPIVFSSGRQILENALLGGADNKVNNDDESLNLPAKRAALVAGAVSACFALAQIGGFGAVANLVGGVAQGTLAFIMPPAIALSMAARRKNSTSGAASINEVGQWLVGVFGVVVVTAVTYSTAIGMMQQ
jgi:proton-coupled amino acid transporter